MSIDQRRKYDSDFKRQAVRLTEDPGRSVGEVAESLGIAKDLLYRWRREHIAQEGLAFPGNGREALCCCRIFFWYNKNPVDFP